MHQQRENKILIDCFLNQNQMLLLLTWFSKNSYINLILFMILTNHWLGFSLCSQPKQVPLYFQILSSMWQSLQCLKTIILLPFTFPSPGGDTPIPSALKHSWLAAELPTFMHVPHYSSRNNDESQTTTFCGLNSKPLIMYLK